MNLPPQISRLRTFVDSPRMAKNPIQIFNEYQGELGETYVFHFGGIKKAILSSNPTVLQHVLKTNYENFPKSEIQMKRMCHFLGRGLLTTHGKLWLSQRRLMQQAFHRSHLTMLIAEMQDVIDESLDKLDENYQGKTCRYLYRNDENYLQNGDALAF